MPDSKNRPVAVAPEENKKVEIDVDLKKLEKKAALESSSSDSSDSEIDLNDALKNSEELQAYLRSHIRNELSTVAPKVFEKIRGEFGLEPIPLLNDEQLQVSWHMAWSKEEVKKNPIQSPQIE